MKLIEYKKEVDAIHAPEELLRDIRKLKQDKPQKRNRKKILSLVAVICVVLVASLIALPAFSYMGMSKSESALDTEYKSEQYELPDSEAAESYTPPGSFAFTTSTSTAVTTPVSQNRKLIRNAEIGVDTKKFDTFCADMEKKASELGGFVESSDFTQDGKTARFASLTLRIPAEKLDSFLESVATEATVRYKTTEVQDVTENYIDIESRINSLKTEQEALLRLLEKAESLSDILEIQGRLTEVRGNLESIEGQLKSLDGQIAYSTVNVYVNEVEFVAPEGDDSFFSQVRIGLVDNLHSIGQSARSTAVFLLASLPYILIWAAVIAVVVLIVVRIRRKRKLR